MDAQEVPSPRVAPSGRVRRALDSLSGPVRRPRLWLSIFALFLAVQITPWWSPGNDACSYLSIARSMVRGERIGRLGDPQLFFAPGYPLIVSPAFLLGQRPFLAVAIIHWVLAVALMLGVYRWASRYVPGHGALVAGLVMGNASFCMYYRETLSELAFMTILVWAVDSLHTAASAGSRARSVLFTLLGAALVAFLSAIRHVGVFLAAGFGLALLIDALRRRILWPQAILKTLAVGIPASLLVVGLILHDRAQAQQGAIPARTYLDFIADPGASLASQLVEGLRVRIVDVGRLLVPGMVKARSRTRGWLDPNLLVYLPVALGVLLGWWRFVKRSRDIWALTLPFYLAIYIVWPFRAATRYTLPMLPLLWLSAWAFLERFPRLGPSALKVFLAVHLAASAGFWIQDLGQLKGLNSRWPEMERIALPIQADPAPAIALDLDDDLRLMVQFVLDRQVVRHRSPSPIDHNVRWILLPQEREPLKGYSVRVRGDSVQLLERARPER